MRLANLALAGILVALAGCGGAPVAPEPPLRSQAFAAEQDGARRHARGDPAGAARSFAAAERQFAALDDGEGVARNRRYRARMALQLGDAEGALALADPMKEDTEAQLIAAQALLAGGRVPEAELRLAAAASGCGSACPHAASIALLRARRALAAQAPAEAEAHARGGLALLLRGDATANAVELANAHRLLGDALLAAARPADAEGEIATALELDRRAANPEKIARDWLLLGDIRRRLGSDAQASARASEAYRRARAVAEAAGLAEITKAAEAALAKE